jgi:hypothetical protein
VDAVGPVAPLEHTLEGQLAEMKAVAEAAAKEAQKATDQPAAQQ